MSVKLFITGTDTDAGKTYVGVGILNAFNRAGKSTLGIKPVASGCSLIDGKLHNNDALALQAASSIKLDYDKINPFAFEPAIAPHVAARQVQRELNVNLLHQKIQYALNQPADICLIEGVGGWYTPLNDQETMADFVKINSFQTILVVGMRLGCLNHAILTMRALQQDNIHVIGWIANCIDPNMANRNESIETLRQWLGVPCLGVLGHGEEAQYSINLELIL